MLLGFVSRQSFDLTSSARSEPWALLNLDISGELNGKASARQASLAYAPNTSNIQESVTEALTCKPLCLPLSRQDIDGQAEIYSRRASWCKSYLSPELTMQAISKEPNLAYGKTT